VKNPQYFDHVYTNDSVFSIVFRSHEVGCEATEYNS